MYIQPAPFEPGILYHLYNHGNGDDNIFRCDENYYYFLRKYKEYIYPIAETYAYNLMPNHFHFVLRIRNVDDLFDYFDISRNSHLNVYSNLLSRKFSNFFNGYTKAFNKMFDRTGKLFRSSVKRKRITDINYLIRLIHYVHFNAVHHGFVNNMEDWEFSSYYDYNSRKENIIDFQQVLNWFEGVENFIGKHKEIPLFKIEFEY